MGGAPGRAAKGVIVWKAVDAWARVRGDLPDADLARIAAATTVTGGRPVVAPVKGFEALVDNPYRSRVVRNARFDAADLGEGASLGDGLVYLSGAICGGLEDRLYEADARPAGKVNGKPAVVSGAFGGNGVLAWEPALGVVAIVGYSGAPMDDDAVAALRRIAERSRLLDVGQWKATRPLARQGTNDFS
ncbi:hypothetical protein [Spirillospora sp. NPDC047279]|uniref:hypothetical protein n=1 Tax=Spirillospora sp. NPDC047279 TaxID=3155478 RepID=UPI0033FCC2B6